jgi:uncharacterized protein
MASINSMKKGGSTEILPDIEIIGLSLYLRKEKALIISDLHIGLEESLNKEGVLVPRFQLKALIQALEEILAKAKPEKIIINGDIKHEFGTISEQEWRDTLKVIDFLGKNSKELILIKGNHDTILGPIAGKRTLKTADHLLLGDIYITHGDRLPEEDNPEFSQAKTIIIGHEHPAVSISEGARSELFKCFLLGSYKKRKLIVLPSFNFVTEGTDILREQLLSPYLTSIRDFEIYVAADKAYHFGKVGSLLRNH